MIFREIPSPLIENGVEVDAQGRHDRAYLELKAWLENHKGFSSREASGLVSHLDSAYKYSLHDKVTQIMTRESSYNKFMYHFIEFGVPYRNISLTPLLLIERVRASETSVADLRFCRLGTMPLLSLQEIISNIPEHVTTIDFSYNIFNANFNQLIDIFIQSGKIIMLDDLPFTKQLDMSMAARKYNLQVSEVLTSAHFCEMSNQTPDNKAGEILFNFFRPTSNINSQVKNYCLDFIRP